jgi:glucosamine 6-phosphate synthetase-like amidotransferase/phosphosugar isomerase protein
MCGIFGVISSDPIDSNLFVKLGKLSERRGRDSSGALFLNDNFYQAVRADKSFSLLVSELKLPRSSFIIGHSRLITNGQADNQPVIRDDIAIVHNGIITNDDEYWNISEQTRLFMIDTEAILGVASGLINKKNTIDDLFNETCKSLKGAFS